VVGAFVKSQERLLIATSKGYIKKVSLADFEYKAQGTNIIKPTEEQGEVVSVVQSPEEGDILIFTKKGKALRFPISEVSSTKGVVGIKLNMGDSVAGIRVLRDEKFLLIITEKGSVEKLEADWISTRKRGSKGLEVLALRRDRIVDILPLRQNGELELMLITTQGAVFYDKIREEEISIDKVQKRWNIEEDTIKRVVVKYC